MDTTIVLYALRYALGREDYSLPKVSMYIEDNIHDISNPALKTYLEELDSYCQEHEKKEDDDYVHAKILATSIRRELYGGD